MPGREELPSTLQRSPAKAQETWIKAHDSAVGEYGEGERSHRTGYDYGTFFQKGQAMGTGQCPVKRYNEQLRDLIVARRAAPSLLVSHELPLTEAPGAYKRFDQRADGFTKVPLHPANA